MHYLGDRAIQCPACQELAFEFDRNFAYDDLSATVQEHARRPVLACYCPSCDQVVISAVHAEDDVELVRCFRDADWRLQLPSTLSRPHAAYEPQRIQKFVMFSVARLEYYRQIRQLIGPLREVDSSEALWLLIPPADVEPIAVISTFAQWLRNAKAGCVTGHSAREGTFEVRLEVTNRPRFFVQLDRLKRKTPLSEAGVIYFFNEGRRYPAGR